MTYLIAALFFVLGLLVGRWFWDATPEPEPEAAFQPVVKTHQVMITFEDPPEQGDNLAVITFSEIP